MAQIRPQFAAGAALFAAMVAGYVLYVAHDARPARAAESVPSEGLTCAFKHDVHEFVSLAQMPVRLRALLPAPMADKGEDFNTSDALGPGKSGDLPFKRFIRAGSIGDLVFVWFEYGGRAYGQTLRLLAVSPSAVMSIALPAGSRSGDLCAQTDAVLDIVLPARDYRTCKFSPAIAEGNSLNALPAAIRADLPASLADKGQPFNAGDAIIVEAGKRPLPSNGLLRIGHLGPRWFVWIYWGGAGSILQTRIYDETGKRLATQMGWDNVCGRTEALLTTAPTRQ